MSDPRISNLARILVEHSVDVQPGHTVHIGCWPYAPRALPYVREITRAVLRAGGQPMIDLEPEFFEGLLLTNGDDAQLAFVDPRLMLLARDIDRSIVLTCEENTHRLSGVDPQRQAQRAKSFAEYHEITNRRTAEGSLRWVLTLVPTSGYAQDAEMSLEAYEDFFFKATFADSDKPIERWVQLQEFQAGLVSWLEGRKQVEIKGPHADLTLSIEGRPFINCYGDANLPDGEIFTAPVEDSAHGWIRFTYPAIYRGREVAGVELQFEKGKVVKATAEKEEALLHATLDMDEGARFLGEFGIGTNKGIDRFTKNSLFDEKIGGTIHLALGFGYPESGSKNLSALHWDMICDMQDGGQILVDGELFYDAGEFLIG